MVFSSLEFIYLFLPPVLIGFLCLRALKLESAIIWWLIMASLVFYLCWSPKHLILLLFSIGFNYLIHLLLKQNRSKAVLTLGIIVNLGMLGVFKYADFFIGNFNAVTGYDAAELGLILPLAISFYTFQQISFLRDTYQDKLVDCDFKKYVLFVTFFPQLIAGPIVMQRDTIPQFTLGNFSNRYLTNIMTGATLFSIGLFKKIVLADGIAPVANAVFTMADQGTHVPMEAAWLGAIAYTFQIYFDFSGYCDMALGLALMFGIRLPINFNSPYRSLSIVEFWRRWHITLSRFLRDYLYIPLGGNRKGVRRTYINLWLVFLISGLWHGDSWNFVIWGAYHGFWLVLERAFLIRALKWLPAIFKVALTFGIVMLGWLVFRIEDMGQLKTFVLSLARFKTFGFELDASEWFVLFLAIAFSFWNFSNRAQRWEQSIYSTLTPKKAVVISVVTLFLLFTSSAGVVSSEFNPFIYFSIYEKPRNKSN